MKKYGIALLLALSAGTALALPPAVELDRLMLHAKTALDGNAYAEAAENLAKAQKLGIALPEDFALSYATALNGMGKTDEAKRVLENYLNKHGTKGASYKPALALLVQIESGGKGYASAGDQSAAQTGSVSGKRIAAPARPQLPFEVSEEIWRTLEASEAYRNAPRPRTYRVNYQTSNQMEFTGAKNSTLKKPAPTAKSTSTEGSSLGEKCWLQQTRTSPTGAGQTTSSNNYICGGFVSLGMTDGVKTTAYIKALDELKGSLFPLRVGNQLSVRSRQAYMADRRFDSTIATACQVTGHEPAGGLDPVLKGEAWKIHCRNSVSSDYAPTPSVYEADDYYLEDLGVMLSAIGQLSFREKKFFLPQTGSQNVMDLQGDYASRTTTTYTSYDWSVEPKGRGEK
jgi:hypothetical protein